MISCANCTNDALYIYSLNEDVKTYFCATHVPGFLQAQKNAGLLPTVAEFDARKQAVLDSLGEGTNVLEEAAPKPTPKKVAKKKPSIEDIVEETVVIEEELVEEVVVAEIVEEEPVSEDAE